jgi:hypothetical protein
MAVLEHSANGRVWAAGGLGDETYWSVACYGIEAKIVRRVEEWVQASGSHSSEKEA